MIFGWLVGGGVLHLVLFSKYIICVQEREAELQSIVWRSVIHSLFSGIDTKVFTYDAVNV